MAQARSGTFHLVSGQLLNHLLRPAATTTAAPQQPWQHKNMKKKIHLVVASVSPPSFESIHFAINCKADMPDSRKSKRCKGSNHAHTICHKPALSLYKYVSWYGFTHDLSVQEKHGNAEGAAQCATKSREPSRAVV